MVVDDLDNRFLFNASPDLPIQFASNPDLFPSPKSARNSPLSGVFLTNADVDHVAGLLFLREGERLQIHATLAVQSALTTLGVTRVLDSFCGVNWIEPSLDNYLQVGDLSIRAIPLEDSGPRYLGAEKPPGVYSVAYDIIDEGSGARALIAPGVALLNEALRAAANEATAIFLDGTFWSDDELQRVKGAGPTAREMHHLPMKDGTLPFLRELPCRHKIYTHINNTNPVWNPDSVERKEVEACGVTIGYDGMSIEL